ncbi:hypothetical protein J7337_010971 [Fusarium musae]|uniref:Uncharacterized protein n=1 Tax=Fusarium musae TaxID=1042133 RepID=A0A9P8IKF9_9HYPO|nr:hypothetical protein J7337_010971 [Fusarium musae]KAG9498081.1 hypothetical protein J7337_010971 [Fusarium musae]
MADSQLGRDQDDGGDPECLQQTQSRRGQLPAGRWLWTADMSIVTPASQSMGERRPGYPQAQRACSGLEV